MGKLLKRGLETVQGKKKKPAHPPGMADEHGFQPCVNDLVEEFGSTTGAAVSAVSFNSIVLPRIDFALRGDQDAGGDVLHNIRAVHTNDGRLI